MLAKDKGQTEDALAEIMRMGRNRGEVVEAKLFVPIYYFHKEECQEIWGWLNFLCLKFSLTLEGCPVSSVYTTDKVRRMKDSVDPRVSMFVVNHIYKGIGPELVIFVTGDGDFLGISGKAKNKSKLTEFWSVDPENTSRFIRREENFSEIEVTSSLQENPFLVSLVKANKKEEELTDEDKRRLALVAKMADLQLQGKEFENMSILVSAGLGTTPAESEHLLDLLTTLKVAEIHPVTKWVVDVDYFHGLFQYLQPYKESKEPTP